MNNIERIKCAISFSENKREIKQQEELIQEDCSHIDFIYNDEDFKAHHRCLLCNKKLNHEMPYSELEKLPKVGAYLPESYLNSLIAKNVSIEDFFDTVFLLVQNKYSELSELYPEKAGFEIAAMLNQGEIIGQLADEILKNDN